MYDVNLRMQNMLHMIGYGENLGSGFPLILTAWKDAGWGEPESFPKDGDKLSPHFFLYKEKTNLQNIFPQSQNAVIIIQKKALSAIHHCSFVNIPCFLHILDTIIAFKKLHLAFLFEGAPVATYDAVMSDDGLEDAAVVVGMMAMFGREHDIATLVAY